MNKNMFLDQQYIQFLNLINTKPCVSHADLRHLLLNEHKMEIQPLGNASNLYRFVRGNFSNQEDEIVKLMDGMMFDISLAVTQPIYISKSKKKIKIDNLYLFPLDIQEYQVFVVDKMAELFVFFEGDRWIFYCPDEPNNDITRRMFTEYCHTVSLDYKVILNSHNVYVFYILHQKINPMHQSPVSEIKLFCIQSRITYCNSPLPAVMIAMNSLTKNVFETKYDLCNAVANSLVCKFLIVDNKNNHYEIASKKYEELERFGKMCKASNVYERYLNMLRHCSEEQRENNLPYFLVDYQKFVVLDDVFEKLLTKFYRDYHSFYIEKTMPGIHYEYKYQSVFLSQIHLFHLESRISITKQDIKKLMLFVFTDDHVTEVFEQFHSSSIQNGTI